MPIHSASIIGIEATPVVIEADIAQGIHTFTLVGLPDMAIKESRERIRAACKSANLPFPRTRITVNLAPADRKKQGPIFDLPIALSILIASGHLPNEPFVSSVIIGELGLDGSIRRTTGVLAMALMAKRLGYTSMIIPEANAAEVAMIEGITVWTAGHLQEIVRYAKEGITPTVATSTTAPNQIHHYTHDFETIRGQEQAKRGLEIAAAGGHNVLLQGPPGTGKTLLARALPSILPTLSKEESIEVTVIASVAGLLPEGNGLLTHRPFRSPHHSASAAALVGGGNPPRPGDVTLAHRGVLFLDELPEFSKHGLEQLRQPLEDGQITIARSAVSAQFPSRCMLVAAMNPCPCGWANDPLHTCECTSHARHRYQQKLSGPLLDRFDMILTVPSVEAEKLTAQNNEEPSSVIQKRVQRARTYQQHRFADTSIQANADMSAKDLERHVHMNTQARTLLQQALQKGMLSARGMSRIQKVARTIADLANESSVTAEHIAEALRFRTFPSST